MPIVVPIVTEYNGKGLKSALGEIGQAEGALGKLSATGKILGKTLAAAGAAFVAFKGAQYLASSVKAASDLGEALNKNQAIFGEAARGIEAYSKAAAVNLGLTQKEALDATATIATFGKAAGLAGGELSKFSTDLTGLAADLGSFFNVDASAAIDAIGSALRGQFRPIQQYGVLINQAALEQKAFEMGLTKTLGPISQQQRVLAASALIFDQTKDAQGDFSRTQDRLANTTKTLNAAMENAKASIGVGFVDAIQNSTKAMGGAQGLAKGIEEAGQQAGDFVRGLSLATEKLVEFRKAATTASEDAGTLEVAQKSLTGAVMESLNPWGLLVDMITNAGKASRVAAAEIAGAYDSTIRMAQQARAAQQALRMNNANLAMSAYDSGLSRLARERSEARNAARLKRIHDLYGKPGDLEKIGKAGGRAAKGVTKLSDASEKAQARFDKFAERVRKSGEALGKAQDELAAVWDAFRNYSEDKAGWITGQVSIGAAIDAQIAQTQKLANLDRAIVEAWNSEKYEQAGNLMAQRAGESAAVNWVDGFLSQIAEAKGAAQALDQLMASLNPADSAGNKALLDALTTLPPGQAIMAANELVNRGLGPAIAAELSSLQVFAGGVGDKWASQFYSEGIDAAQNQVKGITDELNRRLSDLYKQGRRMGKAVKDGYSSVVASLPANARSGGLVGGDLQAGGINITVNAGHGDPVAIARTIERTLRTSHARTGQ